MNTIPFERYWACVLDHPKGKDEPAFAYIVRVAELAAGAHLAKPAKEMPDVRLPYKEAPE